MRTVSYTEKEANWRKTHGVVVSWEGYRDKGYKGYRVRKAKEKLELNVAR